MTGLDFLHAELQHKIPNAELLATPLTQVPEIRLLLIEESYPQQNLSREQVEWLMDSPPYWAFCWASGQVMARYLLDNTEIVSGKDVIDFGCGSGVVAIAAKLAGANSVIACDLDRTALKASEANADLNRVTLEYSSDYFQLKPSSECVLLIADVFYDAANIPLLNHFLNNFKQVWVADSRVKSEALSGLYLHKEVESHTVPDLAEAADFNTVRIYSNRAAENR